MSFPAQKQQDVGLISALIVDDNTFDRRRLARIANETNLDFMLKEASTAEEFGHMLDQEKFDVIFVDLDLAGASGMHLLPGTRLHHVNKTAAMIMVSGNDQPDVALEALRSGFADYIGKDTLTKAALERATINALQKSRLHNAADTAHDEARSIEAVLRSFSQACSEEMRPMLVRMVRQVRQIKAAALQMGAIDSITEIEETCGRMEEFFQDLESLAQDNRLKDIAGQARGLPDKRKVPDTAADREPETHVKVRRPPRPSLFSRRNKEG